MPDENGNIHAVVLSGGGAHGSFEVGVLKALCGGQCASTGYKPLEPDIFTGTSVGSVNAAFMSSRPGMPSAVAANELEKMWVEEIPDKPERFGNRVFRFRGDFPDFFKPNAIARDPLKPFTQLAQDGMFLAQDWFGRGMNFMRSKESLEGRTLELFDLASYVTVEPLLELVKEQIPMDQIRISDRQLRVIVTNWASGGVELFCNADMTEADGPSAILASAAIPGFFPSVNVKGQPAVDGGVVMNTPLLPAMKAGADVIHMIYLDPDPANIPLDRLANTLDTMDRMMTIQFAMNINRDINAARRINHGLEIIEKADSLGSFSDKQLQKFVHSARFIKKRLEQGRQMRPITIHRYRPRVDMGGVLGLLNFKRERMMELIDVGFNFTTNYDPDKDSVIPWNVWEGNPPWRRVA